MIQYREGRHIGKVKELTMKPTPKRKIVFEAIQPSEPMHPSGLTMKAWHYPFKTQEQRKLVAAWFAKQERDRIFKDNAALV